MLESHVFDITRLIQLAVAPVFLLTAVGTIINAVINRLGRAVDRRRQLEDLVMAYEGGERDKILAELDTIARRIRLSLGSIAFAVFSALLVCLEISFTFVGAFISFDLSKVVAGLFILAMLSLTMCLLMFLREVTVAAKSGRHVVTLQDVLDARK
jgi:NADH:ubiquinone oxidoreductase subunit 3 (subunit A)